MRARHLLLVILLALLSSFPAAAAPSLVRDLYPGTESFQALTGIAAARESGGVLYFPAKDPAHGMELWRTDGTTAGTYRVTDICPGPCDSAPSEITPFHGEVYFAAGDGVAGRELWASNGIPGTPRSARRVRDLCPGPCNSHPSSFQELNGHLLFEAAGRPAASGAPMDHAAARSCCASSARPATTTFLSLAAPMASIASAASFCSR